MSKSEIIVLQFLSTINKVNILTIIIGAWFIAGSQPKRDLLFRYCEKKQNLSKNKLPFHVAHDTIKFILTIQRIIYYISWGDRNTVKIMTNIYMYHK